MIQSYRDLKEYLREDVRVSHVPQNTIKRWLHMIHGNEQCHALRYTRCLRICEFLGNKHFRLLYHIYRWKLSLLGLKYGLRINENAVGKGLNIIHLAGGGGAIINCDSMGEYCSIQSGVVIGANCGNKPVIGNHVDLGLGCKVYGAITIGDNSYILPNAVVTHDVPANAIVGGIPAKVIKYRDPIE